ncbi:MAG: 16S rRNA (uracil(1498)-N(3))-methyltransferase [Clostridia bacterium]
MSSCPRFFVPCENVVNEIAICGEDAHHILHVLRLKKGDKICVCDTYTHEYDCVINRILDGKVFVSVNDSKICESESYCKITLFQGNPKSDKLETIIQKAVELGVYSIVPVMCERSVSRPDEKSADKKNERFNKISLSAAKQSGRGIIPSVEPITSFLDAIKQIKNADIGFVCYEGDCLTDLKSICKQNETASSVAFLIGPEGGISKDELLMVQAEGIPTVTLGKRILRTETAPVYVLSALNVLLI